MKFTKENQEEFNYMEEQVFYYTPVFIDWGLFDVIKVKVCNSSQIGYMDYPNAPYIWVEDIDCAHLVHGGVFQVDWHKLYKTKEEAKQHGSEICRSPLSF